MKYSNTVEYNIKTSLDSKGLTQLKSELQGLELKLQNMGNKGFLDEKTFSDARDQIQGLGKALTEAFNPSLGMLDLSKLNQELKNNDVTAQGLKTAFSSLGAEGQVAFNNLVGELGKLDTGILRTNSQVDKLFTTFSNTFRWGLVSSFFSQFMNAIHSSVNYVKELDDSLTQIMLVTDYNRDSMNQFARSANEAAKAVSMTTTGMTNASLIFAQQGYDLGQSQELATLSAKVANASQQDTATTSDQITAYMNAYGLENSIGELTQAMDNWALIANISAADVGELAQASQRAASMANAVGVSGEQLASQIATIESVTREAPEQIGNGLKTLYARFSDIAAGGEDEDGFTLGKVTSELQAIGVQIFNEMGQIRDVGDIMEDLMVIWDDLDQTSKVAASQALAGKYQVNRFMALMDNSDMYEEYKNATGANATGTLDMMNEEYAQSIEGRSAKLQASLEGLFSTIFNTDDIYPWMDAAQGAIDLLQQFFDALGGGQAVLLGISSLLMQVFSQNMAREINNAATNRAVQQQKIANLEHSEAALSTAGLINPNSDDQNAKNILDFARYMNTQALEGKFNAEQMNQANAIYQEMIQNANAATMANDKLEKQLGLVGTTINSTLGRSGFAPFADFSKAINSIDLKTVLGDLSDKTLSNFFKDVQEQVGPAREGLLNFNQSLQEYSKLASNSGTDTELLQKKMNELQQELGELSNYLDDSTFNRYDNALDEIANDTDNAEGKTNELASSAAHLAEELDKVTAEGVKKAYSNLQEAAFQSANADIAAEDSNATRLAFQESNEKTDHITNILNTMNAVQQLAFAWQAFQNLGSLWTNEDLSTGEKVLQTIMNLTMAMPQLISALQSIKDTQIFDSIGNIFANLSNIPETISEIPKAAELAGSTTIEIQKLLEMEDKGVAAYDKMMEAVGEGTEIADGLEDVWKAGEKATETLGSMDQELVELVKNGGIAETELTGVAKIFADGMATAMTEGATGAGLFAGGLKAVGAAAAEALIPLLPYLAIGAAIAGIAFIIGQEAEKAKKAKEEALEALDETQAKLEEMQSIREQALSFNDKFESKKTSGEGFEGLADEARDLADALVEAEHASESADIRLAATKAAALGTEEAYQELADTVKTASLQAEMDTNTDAQKAAVDVLNTQKADLDEIAQKQATLRDLKEQLNDLDQQDSRRGILEDRIKELEDYISKNQEAVEAVNQLRESQATNVGLQLSQETSDTVHSSGIDNATKRAGTYQEYTGTYDYDTLSAIYSENVADWDKYSELEKIDIMLHTLQDDAQIAAVEIEQILQTNSSIKDMGYAGQGITAEEQRDNITGALENTGLSAQQNLQLMATFDKDASYKEIMDGIAEVQQGLQNKEDFEVLLKAKFDPEQIGEGVKAAIDAYQPTDEDIDTDEFKNLADYIQGADASTFEEGGMLEDVSPDIQANAEALEKLVEGILRYDDAVSTLNDNEEKWRDALSDNADLQDRADAVSELKETYSDFLDLGADVSDSFAENTHNLDLMAEAAQGDVDAYNELLAAASEDIAVNIYGVDENLAALQQMSDYLQSDAFQDVEVGMAIDDQAFYDALNKMSADAGWTAEDMESYLSDIGCSIDPTGFEETANSLVEASNQTGKAEAENLTVTSTTEISSETGQEANTTEYTSAIADVDTITGTSVLPVTAGNLGTLSGGAQPSPVEIPYSIPSVKYTAVPISKTDIQEKTGYAVNTKAEQGGGGTGGVQVKKGSVKRSDSGGTKNRNTSSPRSSSPSGGSCFVTGTLITTLAGFSPIEQIKQGDVVLSYNESLHQLEYSVVIQTMIHDVVEPIYTLYIKDEQLRVTGIHRFLISHDIFHSTPQWVPAADLQIGDWMFLADGTWHLIHNIEVNIEHQIVYNFEVAGNHNYYVGRNQILAHNKGGKSCFVAGTAISTSLGFKPIEIIKADDIVLSYNESLLQNEYSKVVQTMIHNTIEPIYTLYIKNEQLRVTGIHRFLISKDINFEPQWVAAQDLQIGNWVLLADSTWHLIWKIEVNIEKQTVYNFEVSGNHNYYVGRDQILAHNKGGGSGKGGGGGGKAKTAEKKENEKYQKKYYDEVDHQLDKVDKTLDNVEKTTDKLIGTKARAKQNEQLKLLQREIALQEKKLKILQSQEKVDVKKAINEADKKLEEILKKEGLNVNILDIAFDQDGFVRNVDEIGQAIVDAQNLLIKKRNDLINSDGTISDENEEILKEIDKQITAYKKVGDELNKNIDRYNDIVNEELEIKNTIEEIKDQIQDIRIEAYKTSQEAIDNLKDLREEWAKFRAGLYDSSEGESYLNIENPIRQLKEVQNQLTDIYTISGDDARKYYQEIINQQEKLLKKAKTQQEKETYQMAVDYYKQLQNGIDSGEILNNGLMQLAQHDLMELKKIWDNWKEDSRDNPIFGDNKAALEEALRDAQKRLMEFAQEYEELIEDFKDATLDIADHTAEQWDRQLDRFDRVIDQLDRYSDVYSLIYGDASYDMQEAVLNQQAQTLQAQVDTARKAYEDANRYYLEAYEKFVDKSTGLAKEGYEDYMYELEEAMNDAEDTMRETAAEAAEKFVDAFEAAVKASSQSILQGTIGEKDFDHLDRNWEWDKEYIDKYKDTVEKAYEMDKLRSKYTDLLNQAQGMSLQTQNKIRAQMQEQLDLLNGQATVSEYDVKLANAKLEILQKQIALEDAQRNKNKMQLRRDTQGNYRYVYTADQGDVEQARQDLLDSEYDAYEMSKQQQMTNYDDMINAYKRYLSQREEILTNNNLSEAQKIEQIKELWDRFQNYVNAAQEDFKDATAGTVDILQWLVMNGTDYTATAASDMLDMLLDEEGNVVDQSNILWMDMANNMADNVIPKIENAVSTANASIMDKMQQTHDALVGNDGGGGIFGDVSAGANNFGTQCKNAADQTNALTEQTNQLNEALNADNKAFTDAIAKLQNYQMQLEQVSEASSNTAAQLRDTQATLDRANAEKLNYKTQIDQLISGEAIIENGRIVTAEELERRRQEAAKQNQSNNNDGWSPYADAYDIWMNGAWGNGGYWYGAYAAANGTARANAVLDLFNNGYGYRWMDTGGYTGSWGSNEGMKDAKNGKLAVLHQKELVLNATDTENILGAVSLVRQFSNMLQSNLSAIGSQSMGLNSINSTYNPLTEQRVDIQATFPNATDADDIREALLSLSDRAYQYAHKTI